MEPFFFGITLIWTVSIILLGMAVGIIPILLVVIGGIEGGKRLRWKYNEWRLSK